LTGATELAKRGAAELAASSKPLAAALALAAIRDPEVLDGSIEQVASQGFGDRLLDTYAQEMVRLRFEETACDRRPIACSIEVMGPGCVVA